MASTNCSDNSPFKAEKVSVKENGFRTTSRCDITTSQTLATQPNSSTGINSFESSSTLIEERQCCCTHAGTCRRRMPPDYFMLQHNVFTPTTRMKKVPACGMLSKSFKDVPSKRPNFAKPYAEYQRMKRNGYVVLPPHMANEVFVKPIAPLNPVVPQVMDRKQNFLPHCGLRAGFVQRDCNEDWSKEARALWDEFNRVATKGRRAGSVWPEEAKSANTNVKSRLKSSDSGVGTDNETEVQVVKDKPDKESDSEESGNLTSSSSGGGHDGDDEADAHVSRSCDLDSTIVAAAPFDSTVGGIGDHLNKGNQHSKTTVGPCWLDSGYISADSYSDSTGIRDSLFGVELDHSSYISTATDASLLSYQRNQTPLLSPIKIDPSTDTLLYCPHTDPSLNQHCLSLDYESLHQTLPATTRAPYINYAPQLLQRSYSSNDRKDSYQKHKKWITDEILDMIAVRDRLYKRMKKHPSPDIIDMYKKVRNMVVGMTRNAKRAYEKLEEAQKYATAHSYRTHTYSVESSCR